MTTSITYNLPSIKITVCCGDAKLKEGDRMYNSYGQSGEIISSITDESIGNPIWQKFTFEILNNSSNIPLNIDSNNIKQSYFPVGTSLYLENDPNTNGPF